MSALKHTKQKGKSNIFPLENGELVVILLIAKLYQLGATGLQGAWQHRLAGLISHAIRYA